jgi:adenylate kinase
VGIWEPISLGNGREDLPFRTFVDPSATIADLTAAVRGLHLDQGIENSLVVKLENAQNAADVGEPARARALLDAFANELSAQSGKKIAASDAAALVDLAARVKTTLGG